VFIQHWTGATQRGVASANPEEPASLGSSLWLKGEQNYCSKEQSKVVK